MDDDVCDISVNKYFTRGQVDYLVRGYSTV